MVVSTLLTQQRINIYIAYVPPETRRVAIAQGSSNKDKDKVKVHAASMWAGIVKFCLALQAAVFLSAIFVDATLDPIVVVVRFNCHKSMFEPDTISKS